MQIIGRKTERNELDRIYAASGARFVAVYGRRRVGKTFLIKEHFHGSFAFYHTGLSPYDRSRNSMLADQLHAFFFSLKEHGLIGEQPPRSWMEAFGMLRQLLCECDSGTRQVVFIDEMPWLDTPRSRFISALEYFWNHWASSNPNIMLIVCGSATSWIESNLINSKGGLYNRVTNEIKLHPFTLSETEQFFQAKGMRISRYDVAQAYMVFGGIPHYLDLFEKDFSVAQNIDRLLFARSGQLRNEFDRLFGSLFSDADRHISVVRQLARTRRGLTRTELLSATGIHDGGGASKILRGLIENDFVSVYSPFGEKRTERYRLTDHFCLFCLRFIGKQTEFDPQFWQKNYNSPKLSAWRGYAFEEICFAHIQQIKRALGIGAVSSTQSSWVVKDENGAVSQIDMLISRSDNVVNLCEIKFYGGPFTVTRSYDDILRQRVQTIIEHLPKRKTVHLTFITSFGLTQGEYSGQVQRVLTLDDLFD